jgi:Predicted membrane protein (DUF2232)
MTQLVLIGIGAGAATALLFASVASGSLISVLLFYLAPLPILIAALGWSHWAALIAAVFASAGLATVFGSFMFLAFLLGIGLPAWWLGYLALLGRPTGQPAPNDMEWYPAGNLVVWAAILGALIVIAALINFGAGEADSRNAMRNAIERMLRMQMRAPKGPPLDINRTVEILMTVLPPAAAVVTTITNMLNLWLAGRIVLVSGRMKRPLPDLSAMKFPLYAPLLTGAALAASFLPGMVGTAGLVLATAMLVAFAVLGLAVLHTVTRGVNARMLLLGSVYASVIVMLWPALFLILLGLADTALDIRGRVAGRHGPPTAPST